MHAMQAYVGVEICHIFFVIALDGSEWSVVGCSCFTPGEIALAMH